MTEHRYVTAWDVECPKCGAKPNERCKDSRHARAKFHVARTRLTRVIPSEAVTP